MNISLGIFADAVQRNCMKTDQKGFSVCFVKIRPFTLHGNNLIYGRKLAKMGQRLHFLGNVQSQEFSVKCWLQKCCF